MVFYRFERLKNFKFVNKGKNKYIEKEKLTCKYKLRSKEKTNCDNKNVDIRRIYIL